MTEPGTVVIFHQDLVECIDGRFIQQMPLGLPKRPNHPNTAYTVDVIIAPVDQHMDRLYTKATSAKAGDWVRVDGPSCCPDSALCGTICCGISSGSGLAVQWCCGTFNIIFPTPRCLCGCHCCGYVLATCNCCQFWSSNCWKGCCWTNTC